MYSISIAIPVHNQGQYVKRLMQQMLKIITLNDQIILIDDYSEQDQTIQLLQYYSKFDSVSLHKIKFNGDFSQHRNNIKKLCSKDYILYIDADELLYDDTTLLKYRQIMEMNQNVQMFYIPRINIVTGLTSKHIQS